MTYLECWNLLNFNRMLLSEMQFMLLECLIRSVIECLPGSLCENVTSPCMAGLWVRCSLNDLAAVWHCESWLLGCLITEWSGLRHHTAVWDLRATEPCRALSINFHSSTAQRIKHTGLLQYILCQNVAAAATIQLKQLGCQSNNCIIVTLDILCSVWILVFKEWTYLKLTLY